MVWIIVIVALALGLYLYFKFFKIPKIKNLVFIDGGLGAGKSFYSVYLAVRLYKRSMRRYKIARFVFKPFALMKKEPKWAFAKRLRALYWKLEEPILYSNIPLRNIKHAKLTLDILYRVKRPAEHSVILIDDVSLLVDQMNFRDKVLNKQLSVFFKLARHEFGGYIVANSQSLSDVHYSFRYALSDYLYIHSSFRVPFFRILRCQEMQYSADESSKTILSGSGRDVEETLKMVLVRNRYRRYYDSRCYSVLTDGLECYDKVTFIRLCEAAKCADVLTLDELTKKLLAYNKKEVVVHEDA